MVRAYFFKNPNVEGATNQIADFFEVIQSECCFSKLQHSDWIISKNGAI